MFEKLFPFIFCKTKLLLAIFFPFYDYFVKKVVDVINDNYSAKMTLPLHKHAEIIVVLMCMCV